MKLADGQPLKVRGIGKMNVEIGKTLLTHDVWVADIDADIDCIIGYDFMKQNMCCIDVANNTMTVYKEQISCAVYEKTIDKPCEAVTVLNESAYSRDSPREDIPEHLSSFNTNSISDLVYRIQKLESSKPRVVHYNRLKPYHVDFDNWLIKTVIQRDNESHATAIEENNIESDIELSENEQCDMYNLPTDNIEYGRGHRVKRPPNRYVPDHNFVMNI
ncbi:unnamed protein product [Mytilus edulis]|uniref:Integrase p58-like C-terminal domain-containing protein n=1 Tax=Mytilus edulis TaxID=6550 RepID=A0A8S3THB7_MYTED|nr:unnamed protein product [Mytilus edulis]